MPAASSGLSNPESAASYATRLTAANRRLIVVGARCRCSKWIRYRRTTVRLNARRGSEQYQSTNSFIAWSYVRWPLFEVRVFSTAEFVCSRSGRARDRFGGSSFSGAWAFWAASCAAFSQNARILHTWSVTHDQCEPACFRQTEFASTAHRFSATPKRRFDIDSRVGAPSTKTALIAIRHEAPT